MNNRVAWTLITIGAMTFVGFFSYYVWNYNSGPGSGYTDWSDFRLDKARDVFFMVVALIITGIGLLGLRKSGTAYEWVVFIFVSIAAIVILPLSFL